MSKSLKKLNTKISNNVNKNLGSLTKSYNKAIKSNKVINHSLSAVIVLAILLVDHIPVTGLVFLNNSAIRLVVITLICLLCLVDPIKSLLLAILFVVLIQKLHKSSDVVVLEDNEPDAVEIANKINNKLNNVNELLNNNLNKAVNEIVNNVGANAHINVVKDIVKKNVNNNLNEAVSNVVNNVVNKVADVDANVVNEIVNNSLNTIVNKSIDNSLNKLNKDKQNNVNVNTVKGNVVEVVKDAVNNVINNAVNIANNINKGTRFNRAENTNEVDSLGENIGELNRLEKKSNAELIDEVRDDVLNVDNRNARKHDNVLGDNKGLSNKNGISNTDNLLLGDIPGYKVDKSNKLLGDYRKDVQALNNNELIVRNPYRNYNRPKPRRRKDTNVNQDVARYNRNNLVTKNPYPGRVLEMVNNGDLPYSNNVQSYNKANSLAGQVSNVGGFLLEGFQNTPNNIVNPNNKPITNALGNGNLNANLVANANGQDNAHANAHTNAHANAHDNVVGNVDINVNANANANANANSNIVGANADDNTNACVVNNDELQEQLRKAQNRRVYEEGNKTAYRGMNNSTLLSAQGYNNASGITGYNESGADAINYLCTK